jgi:transcriptional regulator with XRE-family HTH domain
MSDVRSAQPVDVKLGQRVKTRRLAIGMSQERLAELTGVTFQQIQKYEKGLNRMAASRLWEIAKALEMPVSDLFEPSSAVASKRAGPDRAAEVMSTSEGAQLVTLFLSIRSKPARRKVVEFVRALAED